LKTIKIAAAAAAVSMLCACGGGGGGGGSTIREVPFSSFPVTNQRVIMTGISQTASGTLTVDGFGNIAITGVSMNAVDEANSTTQLTFNGAGNLSAMGFSTPQSSASFSASQIDCSTAPACAAENAAGTSVGVLLNPATVPPPTWNYQTFGVWLNQAGPTTFNAGAMSAGAVTPGTAVPTVGVGIIFNGFANGFYVDPGRTPHSTAAGMQALVDFENRNINFSTFLTQRGNLNNGIIVGDSSLNLSGTLSYSAGQSRFTGSVSNAGPAPTMTGTADGRFYGPAAQEMGGVYNLNGVGGKMIGGFGGKRL
jgi:hypothetical protein